jgi:hypothetical protein
LTPLIFNGSSLKQGLSDVPNYSSWNISRQTVRLEMQVNKEYLCCGVMELSRTTKRATPGGKEPRLMKTRLLDNQRPSLFWDVTWPRLVVRYRSFGIKYHGSSSPGKIT